MQPFLLGRLALLLQGSEPSASTGTVVERDAEELEEGLLHSLARVWNFRLTGLGDTEIRVTLRPLDVRIVRDAEPPGDR
jgi:hypothetical protein